MSNRINSTHISSLLDNKLAVLLEDYNRVIKTSTPSTEEEVLLFFNKLVSDFYRTLNNPFLESVFKVQAGDSVSIEKLNEMFLTVQRDLRVLYKEIESLHSTIISNYNNVVSLGEKVRSKLRTARSNIATYRLYTNDSLLQFVSDSFENLSLTESNTDQYKEERVNFNLNEGTITLPIDTGNTKEVKISSISITPISNGIAGNNQELNQLQRASLNNIRDGNPNTWFEYEIVTKNPVRTPLTLDLRLVLEEESIINNLEILSNSFAIRNFPKIIELTTSVDGNFFVDLIKDIPISGDETIEGLLTLSPLSGKFSGSNSFSFKPRRVKFVQLKIQQDDHYLIETPIGLQYRKAIGLRDISIRSFIYRNKGEFVSIRHLFGDEIKKLGLGLTSNTFGNLTSIKSEITHNDKTWIELSPIDDFTSNEVISFNTIDTDSINTEQPVRELRFRATLSRDTAKFSGTDEIILSEKPKFEFLNLDSAASALLLEEIPIPSSVRLYNVSYGRTGGESLIVSPSDIITTDDNLFIYLPKAFNKSSLTEDSFKFIVNSEPWNFVSSLAGSSSTDKDYTFDPINNIIITGNNTTGKKPENRLEIVFLREQVLFSSDIPRTAVLNFSSDSVKESFSIYKLSDVISTTNFILQKASRVYQLGITDIDSIAITQDNDSVLVSENDFINGFIENTATGDYSIDYINGKIYSFDLSPNDSDLIISVDFRKRTPINNFSIEDRNLSLDDREYSSFDSEESFSLTAMSVINLGHSHVEPKSVQFLTLSDLFVREVPFKGDGSEFRLDLESDELFGLYTIDYKNGIIYTNADGGITDDLVVRYRFSRIFAEYSIARLIPAVNYSISDNKIVLDESFVIEEFRSGLSGSSGKSLFKVNYNFVEETHDNLRELEPYYTPFLRDYTLKVLPRSNF